MKLTKRISAAKLDEFLARRAANIAAEMRHYEAEAQRIPGQRDYYERMAATERCAWMEVLHVRDVLAGRKQDPHWNNGRVPGTDA